MAWSEAKWMVDNLVKKTGQPPNNMRKFETVIASKDSIGLRFLEPNDSYSGGNLICSVGGVMIRMSDEKYPTSPTEGTLVVDNAVIGRYEKNPFIVNGLVEGKTYYFSAFPYSSAGVYNLSKNKANRVSGEPKEYELMATITVTYPAGAVVTCYKGAMRMTAPDTSGTHTFTVHESGVWTVEASGDGGEASQEVIITENGQSESVELFFAKIYGISRNVVSSSPVWTRTDEAVGMSATASVGSSAGASDFNDVMPWAGMVRETLTTGDIVVKIPKFYYQRYVENDVEHIRIANGEVDGFSLHPAFNHGGIEKDFVCVGAYQTVSQNSTHISKNGGFPVVNLTRDNARVQAKAKGSGWGVLDISTVSAVQMLILVEFATNDVQSAIGNGRSSGSNTAAISSGNCDSVPNLTGRTNHSNGEGGVVYRGIENFWGNVWEWVDGVNCGTLYYYVCNDPSKYSDRNESGYEALSYRYDGNWSSSYITRIGIDEGNNTHIMLPTKATGGSGSTYYCDVASSNSGGLYVVARGGAMDLGNGVGMFTHSAHLSSTDKADNRGYRLMYIPQ